jgi:hypothetical protein
VQQSHVVGKIFAALVEGREEREVGRIVPSTQAATTRSWPARTCVAESTDRAEPTANAEIDGPASEIVRCPPTIGTR